MEILTGSPHASWPDDRLVEECLAGNQLAWQTLVHKYQNLVYGIAIRLGAKQEDAADIFQAVWIQAYKELSNLRKKGSVRSWLITVTRNKSFHELKKVRRDAGRSTDLDDEFEDESAAGAADNLDGLEEMQTVREAIVGLPERCQLLIRLLFYSDPPLAYREVAERLGLAIGSIGFIRGRCLKKLQKALEETDQA